MESESRKKENNSIWSNRFVLTALYLMTALSFGLGFITMASLVAICLCLPDVISVGLTENPIDKFNECYKQSVISVLPVVSGIIFGFLVMYPSYRVLNEVLFGDRYIRSIL